jgi:peptide/nickel transport system ATP-binding protein
VRLLCDRIVVMRGGEIVEQGTAEQVMDAPRSDYTRSLLDAVPRPPSDAGPPVLPPRAVSL